MIFNKDFRKLNEDSAGWLKVISTNFYKIHRKFYPNPLIIAVLFNNECNILFFKK